MTAEIDILGAWVGCDVALCATCLAGHCGPVTLEITRGPVVCDRCGRFMNSSSPVVDGRRLGPSDRGTRIFVRGTGEVGTLSSWNTVNVFVRLAHEPNRWRTKCVPVGDASWTPPQQQQLPFSEGSP